MTDLTEYEVEVIDDTSSFRFRLKHKPTGRKTGWAGYTQVCALDDVAVGTDYYCSDSYCKPMLAKDFLAKFAVVEHNFMDNNEDDEVAT